MSIIMFWKKISLVLVFCGFIGWCFSQPATTEELARWNRESSAVTIIRDNWGIPHVYGKTDADAVFGLLYAQCEDDFMRVEMNYIEKLGRRAEVNGPKDIYNDLLIRLVIDSTDAMQDYAHAQDWLKKLCDAFADGVNYFLYKNPSVHPALLKHFEPWYAMMWTDGSIGAISTAGITAKDLENFYSGRATTADSALPLDEEAWAGSNGFAFAPSITASHHSILYINPHVTFYFRPEVHMASDEGLNAYGAVTWGQFFVYQGFNEHCGWMHTSSEVDVSDSYIEDIDSSGGMLRYKYEDIQKPVIQKEVVIRYLDGDNIRLKRFNTYRTGHGPVMASKNGHWISVRSFNRSGNSLIQSWLRTKADSFEAFKKVMERRGNTSNNTVYADAEGNIAYWHGNFIPRRDPRYDYSQPVDGTIAATDWQGIHELNEIVHVLNPASGWIQNCNSTPFTVSGRSSPKIENFPRYMAPDGENFRAINAIRLLTGKKDFTMEKVVTMGYDRHLSAFDSLLPALVRAYESLKPDDSISQALREPMTLLKDWEGNAAEGSIAENLAVEWGRGLLGNIYTDQGGSDIVSKTWHFAKTASPAQLLGPLSSAVRTMTQRWGNWRVAWGKINRFQRINDDLQGKFSDDQPSIPVAFASSTWGQIPAYNSSFYPGTNERYGVSGNSFICVVEFGKTVKARSLLAGGESGNPDSRHFTDQAEMYTHGQFKDVYFYKADVLSHATKTYHPGE